MRLMNLATGLELKVGNKISKKDEEYEVTDFEPPHKVSSSGRIYVKHLEKGFTQGYFPAIFNAKFCEEKTDIGIIILECDVPNGKVLLYNTEDEQAPFSTCFCDSEEEFLSKVETYKYYDQAIDIFKLSILKLLNWDAV